LFTRDEVRAALVVLGIPPEHLEASVDQIFELDSAGGIVFDELLLSAVGSLSEEAARRVATWLRESADQTIARTARFEAEMHVRRREL
jgi:hypothetical protein